MRGPLSDHEFVKYDMAHALGLTVGQLDDMPYDEFVGWQHYFQERPPGWREDLRSYYIMAAQGVDKRPEEIFPSILAVRKADAERMERRPELDNQTDRLVKSGFLGRLLSAAKTNGSGWELSDAS
jgi:hypothetical protein